LSFEQQKQQLLEYLRFADGSTVESIQLEKGRITWTSYPVELADGLLGASRLYQAMVMTSDLMPILTGESSTPGLLLYRIDLKDAVLYVLASESDRDTNIDLGDKITGAPMKLRLPAQRAALVLIDKKTKQIVAKYGF
jgi:hypothetical protein